MATAKVLYVDVTGISSEILKNLILAGIRGSIADGRPYPDALCYTPTSFLPPQERINDMTSLNENDQQEKDHDGEGVDSEGPMAKKAKKMTVAKAIQPYVYELNPLLEECEIKEESDVENIPDEYFSKFDIVVASHIGSDQAIRIARATVAGKGKFYLVHGFGLHACALMDLGEGHEFRRETGKDTLSDVMTFESYLNLEEILSKKLVHVKDRWHKDGPPKIYVLYRSILNYHSEKNTFPCQETEEDFVTLTKKFLKDQGLEDDYIGNDQELKHLANCATADISPVCSVMGGVIGNEIIKVISGKGEPATNMLFFNGEDGGCSAFLVK
jgi:Dinucleotide-utilizing enzymes involved in molybdopterin and thiamine biosynthesis family 2